MQIPSAPIEVNTTPLSPTVIHVHWNAPSITNGTIVNYIVTYTQVGSGTFMNISTGSGSILSRTLVGLTPNTTYQMIVRAQNEHGVGMASEIAMGTTLSVSSESSVMCGYAQACNVHAL